MDRHYEDKIVMDLQKFYNRMNALKTERHGSIIRTTGAGWFEFRENRLRGYVRLMAQRNGVALEPEHHLGERLHRKRYELPRRPGGYDRVLKRVGIQY